MTALLLLIASIVPLALGPVVARKAEGSTFLAFALDSFVTVAVGGSMLLHVLPEAFEGAGWWVLPMSAGGFMLPFAIHRWWHHHIERTRSRLFWLAFVGLALHATLDGVALFAPFADTALEAARHGSHNGEVLALAVILHRLPMALAIWWLARPVLGQRSAIRLLAGIAAATVVGFALAGPLWESLPAFGVALMEAAVAGMLLHIVIDHHGPAISDHAGLTRRATAFGALAGIVFVLIVSILSPDQGVGGPWQRGAMALLILWLIGSMWRGRPSDRLQADAPFTADGQSGHHTHRHHGHHHGDSHDEGRDLSRGGRRAANDGSETSINR